MKSQFVKIHSLQGNGNGKRPEQSAAAQELSTVEGQPVSPSDWLQGETPAPSNRIPQRPAKRGLLSNWNASSFQHPHLVGTPGPKSVAEQETLKHQVVNGPITGPAHNSNIARRTGYLGDANGVQVQNFAHSQVQVSPHTSGITSLAAVQTKTEPEWPWRSPSKQPPGPGSQPLPPAAEPAYPQSQPYNSPFAMPGLLTAPVPLGGYRGGPGGPAIIGSPPQPTGNYPQGREREKRRVPMLARVIVGIIMVILVVVGGVAGYLYYTFSAPVGNIVNQQVPRAKGEEDPNASRNGGDILSGPRINILLLGSDTDQKFTNADGTHTYLAQSDIVVTIDPATKSVGMLSIPRDFYINVPGYGMHKLDEAYALGGEAAGSGAYSPGGVALSRLTIEQDFGIPINYYAWVGLDGFVKVINTVGGVNVDVLHPITDDNYPDDVGNTTGDFFALKRLYIPPGPQHLDGLNALEYVRSRHADLVGDFGRSARQQQVLSALKTKLNNPDIVGKLPEIANDLNGYVKTDMQLADVFKLMNFARSLDQSKINRIILGPPYSNLGTLSNGTSVVFPHCGAIVPEIAKMFDLVNKAVCNIGLNSSNNTSAAVEPQTSPSFGFAVNIGASLAGILATSKMASTNAMSIMGGTNDLFGIHSLLDLMLLIVFDSPQALQV